MTDSSFRVGVKDAVKAALSFIKEMVDGKPLKDVLLEEVELAPEADAWLVPVGFALPQEEAVANAPAGSKKLRRTYKSVTINAQSGVPLAMKIREL
ncbi:MAG: hypothetical protein FJ083_15190 [Cyanobacteria bacterium K_Offshore_surface_m2_239]|nr:hypothetical protein [Cyanobacteria bacterium K_Offshore_surface_m2_239]